MREKYEDDCSAGMGAEAIRDLLAEIDLKQHFDEDDDIVVASDDETLEEDQVMTSMDGFLLDEDQDDEGNMFDESSIYEDADDMLDYDDFGSDEE